MTPSQIFVAAVVIILFFVMVFIGNKNSKTKRLSIMSSIAFGFIVAGAVFGENRLISYSLFAIGIIISIVDAYIKSKK
jgi:hypothetical protein